MNRRLSIILCAGLFLFSCSSVNHRTIVENEDASKVASINHVSVVYLSSGKISFGDVVTKPAESSQEWQVSETIEKAVQSSLDSVGKHLDSFRTVLVEKGKVPAIQADPQSDAIILIGEKAFCQQDCCYSGIGILMDKRKRLFQTVVQPFAMLEVGVKLKDGSKPLRAYNSRNVGKLGGSTASNVDGVSFHGSLAEFPPNERTLLKDALQKRIEVVVNALFTDLGFGKDLNP
jgi:hypothetical protein